MCYDCNLYNLYVCICVFEVRNSNQRSPESPQPARCFGDEDSLLGALVAADSGLHEWPGASRDLDAFCCRNHGNMLFLCQIM